jgi:hypothetical protein
MMLARLESIWIADIILAVGGGAQEALAELEGRCWCRTSILECTIFAER